MGFDCLYRVMCCDREQNKSFHTVPVHSNGKIVWSDDESISGRCDKFIRHGNREARHCAFAWLEKESFTFFPRILYVSGLSASLIESKCCHIVLTLPEIAFLYVFHFALSLIIRICATFKERLYFPSCIYIFVLI